MTVSVVTGLLANIGPISELLPKGPSNLSLATYDTDNGRKRLTKGLTLQATVDLSQSPKIFLRVPVRLALLNKSHQNIEKIRVQFVYEDGLEVFSDAQQKILVSGQTAYERTIETVTADDEIVFLPIEDTLRFEVAGSGVDVISITKDGVPDYMITLVLLPYSPDHVNSMLRGGSGLPTRRDISLGVVVKADRRPDISGTASVSLDIGLQLLHPSSNLKWKFEPVTDGSAAIAEVPTVCRGDKDWSTTFFQTGKPMSFRECSTLDGQGRVQVISHDNRPRRWIIDSDSNAMVDYELLNTDGDLLPDQRAVVEGQLPFLPWPVEATQKN